MIVFGVLLEVLLEYEFFKIIMSGRLKLKIVRWVIYEYVYVLCENLFVVNVCLYLLLRCVWINGDRFLK